MAEIDAYWELEGTKEQVESMRDCIKQLDENARWYDEIKACKSNYCLTVYNDHCIVPYDYDNEILKITDYSALRKVAEAANGGIYKYYWNALVAAGTVYEIIEAVFKNKRIKIHTQSYTSEESDDILAVSYVLSRLIPLKDIISVAEECGVDNNLCKALLNDYIYVEDTCYLNGECFGAEGEENEIDFGQGWYCLFGYLFISHNGSTVSTKLTRALERCNEYFIINLLAKNIMETYGYEYWRDVDIKKIFTPVINVMKKLKERGITWKTIQKNWPTVGFSNECTIDLK